LRGGYFVRHCPRPVRLRWMRGQDWTNQRGVEPGAKLSRLNAGGDHATDSKSKRTAARSRARQHMRSIASDMVSIFSDIIEMREIADSSYVVRGRPGWTFVMLGAHDYITA